MFPALFVCDIPLYSTTCVLTISQIMQRFQTGKVIALNVVVWGVISMCIAACKNFAGLAVCRFMLGFFESLSFPGFSLVIGSWYTRSEQVSLIHLHFITHYCSHFGGGDVLLIARLPDWPSCSIPSRLSPTVFSLVRSRLGLLQISKLTTPDACSHIDHDKFAQWRALFLLVGGLTFLLGLLMLAFLPNSPMTAKWLTPRQRCIAVMRVQKNKTGISNKTFKVYQLREALLDPKSWLLFIINVGLNIPNGGES